MQHEFSNSVLIATGPVECFVRIDKFAEPISISGVQMYGAVHQMSFWWRLKVGPKVLWFILRASATPEKQP